MLDLSTVLSKLASRYNKPFIYRDQTLEIEKVFALDGALPLLIKRANLLADFLFGRKLDVALASDPEALTGERVKVMPEQSLFVLVMLIYDVLEELVVSGSGSQIELS